MRLEPTAPPTLSEVPIPGCEDRAIGFEITGCAVSDVDAIVCQPYKSMDPCPAEPTEPLRPRLISEDGLLIVVRFPQRSQWVITSSAGGRNAGCTTNRFVAVGNSTVPSDPGSPALWYTFDAGRQAFIKPAALSVVCDVPSS